MARGRHYLKDKRISPLERHARAAAAVVPILGRPLSRFELYPRGPFGSSKADDRRERKEYREHGRVIVRGYVRRMPRRLGRRLIDFL